MREMQRFALTFNVSQNEGLDKMFSGYDQSTSATPVTSPGFTKHTDAHIFETFNLLLFTYSHNSQQSIAISSAIWKKSK